MVTDTLNFFHKIKEFWEQTENAIDKQGKLFLIKV